MTKSNQFCALALAFAMTAALGAQEKPPAPTAPVASQPAPPPGAQVPLKIQVVLSRYMGEKKLSSAPYMLSVTANDSRRQESVRMGVQIPIPGGGSYSYKDVGTNIDCQATSTLDGRFKVALTVSDSSVYFPDQDSTRATGAPPQGAPALQGVPAFRSFTSTFSIWLRDGQTSQYTSVTDQVSGQVLKIDATLTVLK